MLLPPATQSLPHFIFRSSSVVHVPLYPGYRRLFHSRLLRHAIDLCRIATLQASRMSDTSASDSAEEVFTTCGLHRALTATTHTPPKVVPMEKELKNAKYQQYVNERHETLVTELYEARKVFEHISEERDKHEATADSLNAPRLNRKYLEASNRVAEAQREYRAFKVDLEELRAVPKTSSRDDVQLWADRKSLEKHVHDKTLETSLANGQLLKQYEDTCEELESERKWAKALKRKDVAVAKLFNTEMCEVPSGARQREQGTACPDRRPGV